MLELTRNNALNWLELILNIYPLTREEEMRIIKFLRRSDKKTREREMDKIFGGQ